MCTFQIAQQKSGAVAVTRYQEGGTHIGAVAVLQNTFERGPLVWITKPISLTGARAVLEKLEEVAKTLPAPESSPAPEPPEPTPEAAPAESTEDASGD